mgnify:CR=1 FL=1
MAKNNKICAGVSMSECASKGTIGGYTVIKETTMKQIDTASSTPPPAKLRLPNTTPAV